MTGDPRDRLLSILLHGDPPTVVVDDLGRVHAFEIRVLADYVALLLDHRGVERVAVQTQPLRALVDVVADLPNQEQDLILFEATTQNPDDAITAADDLAERLARRLS